MPAEVIDGAAIARTIREEVARDVAALSVRGMQPGLAVVLVGDDPASTVYVRNKDKACTGAGMHGVTVRLPASISQQQLLSQVDDLNADPAIHGFLVQMPLPRHLDADAVIRRIDPKKDVDGFHPVNVGKMLIGDTDGFVPATPAGVRELLARSDVETDGQHCVIIGRSNIVGKPMAAIMLQNQPGANATVTVCHSRTKSLPEFTRRADILIVAAGKANMLRGDMVKPGAVVIDVGINRVNDESAPSGHRLVGDVEFDSVREVASKLTPVPGGVGPMTIAMLLRNTVRAAERAIS
ncbi:MAG: bifunctional methylenetetrahydrofolate dehydrogenase/methenyltetrahydrofolate cyclohydrolase FolD [Anaerolineae bacterium]|nr:bifunctional methylenetetrahydrofolate dehydrogenase/methenyltetrahydrofolate cyclohydrolase FolD [Gemmatimonadaceae bacterium]